jgi:uncharacterized protein (DUF2147 family)
MSRIRIERDRNLKSAQGEGSKGKSKEETSHCRCSELLEACKSTASAGKAGAVAKLEACQARLPAKLVGCATSCIKGTSAFFARVQAAVVRTRKEMDDMNEKISNVRSSDFDEDDVGNEQGETDPSSDSDEGEDGNEQGETGPPDDSGESDSGSDSKKMKKKKKKKKGKSDKHPLVKYPCLSQPPFLRKSQRKEIGKKFMEIDVPDAKTGKCDGLLDKGTQPLLSGLRICLLPLCPSSQSFCYR